MTDPDYVDDHALVASKPGQAEALLHILARTVGSISLNVIENKTVHVF